MYVVFLHGPPASGKYTIGRAVAGRLHVPLFHNHLTVDLVSALFEFGSPPFVKLRESVWLDAFDAAAGAGRSFVFTFSPEATVQPDFVPRAVHAVEARGGRVHFVALECPEAEIEARLANADRERWGKLRSLDFYRQLRESGAFDYPALPAPLLRIPTAQLPVAEAAARIEAALARAGVETGA